MIMVRFFRHLHLDHVLVWEFIDLKISYDVRHLDEDPRADRWSPIRPFLAAINTRREQVINPSYIVVEDELMSSWISRKQDRTTDGIPHLTKIIRKPKGVGTEIICL